MTDQTSKIVFVDTSAIGAVISETDSHHHEAESIFKRLGDSGWRLYLTNFVISETHACLLRFNKKTADSWLLNSAYQDFNVVRPDESMEEAALAEIEKYDDKTFSLVDVLSFLSMEKMEIAYYFAFDRNFGQIGKFCDVSVLLYNNNQGIR